MDERLLGLYEEELHHLRVKAAEFAKEFPKVAARLALEDDPSNACPDPYVERLLEGFSFLAARVRRKLEAGFPLFAQGVLETVMPDYLCPVPSTCIVEFAPDPTEGALAEGVRIPRGTLLRGHLSKREHTRATFSSAHDVVLYPLKVDQARYHGRDVGGLALPQELGARAAISIRLKKTIQAPFEELKVPTLTFHLHGHGEMPVHFYEQIFSRKCSVIVQSPHSKEVIAVLPPESLRKVGFESGNALLPVTPRGFEGYRLLKEYFILPQRFLFFELTGLESAIRKAKGNEVQLVIALQERENALEDQIGASNFRLYCSPAVNLFEKQLDRIPVEDSAFEYHLVPDRNRPLDFEVYRVLGVSGYGETLQDEQVFSPFYLARDADAEVGSAYFTTSRVSRLLTHQERQTGRVASYAGTDLFVSLVDSRRAPCHPGIRQLGVRALCSNRHLPLLMPLAGDSDFTMETGAPVVAIRLITGPTPPRASPAEGDIAWRLIDQLALNYFSISDGSTEDGARVFRELLALYVDPTDKASAKQIESVCRISNKPILRRVVAPGPISFARGLEITVELDESGFQGSGAFLFGAILEEFFARYVGINSFTETVLSSLQRKEIMRWPARTGKRHVI